MESLVADMVRGRVSRQARARPSAAGPGPPQVRLPASWWRRGAITPSVRNAVALLQPQMASALTNAFNDLNSLGITPTINSGYRSPADQMRMRYGASGPNRAAVVSWHQAGMAVDINGTSSSYFPTIVGAMSAQGLTWCGTFPHRDPPHFRMPPAGTKPTAAMVSACAAGGR